MARIGKLAMLVAGGALAGLGLSHRIFGSSIAGYLVFAAIGAIFFPWLVARTSANLL